MHFAASPKRLPPLVVDPTSVFVRVKQSGTRLSILHPESHDPAVALALARWICRRRASLDFAIFTGDLATTGAAEDLEAASAFFKLAPLNAKSAWIGLDKKRATIRGAIDQDRVVVLPGNHDRYHPASKLFLPGNGLFEQHFEELWPRHSERGSRIGYSAFLSSDENAVIVVICADFTLSDVRQQALPPIGYLGEGLADESTISQLIEATNQVRDFFPGCAVVWSIHFCPIDSVTARLLRLQNGHSVIQAARKSGVEHIFCGHVHEDIKEEAEGVHIYSCASTTAASSNRNRQFSEFVLDVDGGKVKAISRRKYVYQFSGRNKGEFEEIS